MGARDKEGWAEILDEVLFPLSSKLEGKRDETMKCKTDRKKAFGSVQGGLLLTAAVLLAAGVYRGEAATVFIKAAILFGVYWNWITGGVREEELGRTRRLRLLCQAAWSALTNGYAAGFLEKKIYTGKLKEPLCGTELLFLPPALRQAVPSALSRQCFPAAALRSPAMFWAFL